MKILVVHEIDWIKKVPFEPQHLAELFSIKGHDVFVIDCARPNLSEIYKGMHTLIFKKYHRLYDDASITLIRPSSILFRGLNRLTHFLTCKKIIKKTILENEIDLILLYGVATNGIQCIQLSKELNIPLVFRCLDIGHQLVNIPLLHNIAKKYEKIVSKHATKVLATTPELTKYTIEMGANNLNAEFFPLGISPQFFKPVPKSESLAQNLGIKNSDKVIGFIGTIYPFAGLDFLLKKFHIIKNEIKGVKFLIIGGGPHFNEIKSLIKKLNLESDVILTGFVKQEKLSEYISLFDICINPFVVNDTTDRIIPTKILEYMACQKPVLSTPLKGTVELLPDESFGIVYSSQNDFVNTLLALLSNTQKLNELGKNGLLHIQENYYWDALTDKLLLMFGDIIQKHSKKRV